jgi:hypothetical protein
MQAAIHYGVINLDRTANWHSEPRVDEEIFLKIVEDAHVDLHFHERLKENGHRSQKPVWPC